LLLVVRKYLPVPTKRAEASRGAKQFGRLINLYRVLGVRRGADGAKIKAAYRRLVKQFHPDIKAGDARAAQRTKDLIGAYRTLGEPEARSAYDIEFARQRGEARARFLRSMGAGIAFCSITVGLLFLFLKTNPSLPPERPRETAATTATAPIEAQSRVSPAQAYRARSEDKPAASSLDGEAPAPATNVGKPSPQEGRAGSPTPVIALPSETPTGFARLARNTLLGCLSALFSIGMETSLSRSCAAKLSVVIKPV